MNKFEKPQGPEAQDNNIIAFQTAKTRLKENQPSKENSESIRTQLRTELMDGCDAITEEFRRIEEEGLSNVRLEFAKRSGGANEEVYQAIKAYRAGALDVISQSMPAEELLEIGKMISTFFEEMNQRANLGRETIRRAQSRREASV